MLKNKKTIFSFFSLLFFGLASKMALAQDFGVDPIEGVIALEQGDPRVIIGRVIQIILSMLGVIALGLIIYAGSIWMTSNGEEEKIRNAKNILKNAVIGLIIILSSWAITTYIISTLSGAISGGGGGANPRGDGGNGSGNGIGVIGSCSVQSVYPENEQRDVPRNSSIIITFKEELDLSSVCVDDLGVSCACGEGTCSLINPEVIRIYKNDLGDACTESCPEANLNTNLTDVNALVSSDNKTLILRPLNYLGSPTESVYYQVKITDGLKKTDSFSMFSSCSANSLVWNFEVGTKLDFTPPQVISQSLFPSPDNFADTINNTAVASRATGEIFVKDCPKTYRPAQLISVAPETEVSLNYHGSINKFTVVIPAGSPNKAQLFNANNNVMLGMADFNDQNIVSFAGYLSLKAEGRAEGNSWTINIVPEQLADNLVIGNLIYTFATSTANNNILVPTGSCDTNEQAANIHSKISGHPSINISRSGSRLNLEAKVAGSDGNNIALNSSNNNALELQQFSGGSDAETTYTVNDKKDVAMNAIIKIRFNEPINPIVLSGLANEVKDNIKVLNAAGGSNAGSSCGVNSDCLSYKCDNLVCIGDYLDGQFLVSSNYTAVEFISNNECGINGCGEKMYCLPENSNLTVAIKAADLYGCDSDQDCAALSPYTTCIAGELGYKTCQNDQQNNYPMANMLNLTGVTDLAFNSLDGNRDSFADGQITYFNENINNPDLKDGFLFSFFVNNKKESTVPKILSINPTSEQSGLLSLADPVNILFNTLMMSSTLRSGGISIPSKDESFVHRYINLKSSIDSPLGYWSSSEDKDSYLSDGIYDSTLVSIKHSPFLESITYSAQAGSGVKDIYQNCYKPSAGPGCEANVNTPSCCFGNLTSSLEDDGSCPSY